MIKPIPFNNDEVMAILDGQKTQTRKPVKKAGWQVHNPTKRPSDPNWDNYSIGYGVSFSVSNDRMLTSKIIKPPCQPGDVLWVRETWARIPETSPGNLHYKASATEADSKWFKEKGWKWNPPITMPQEAARLFLCVKDVGLEKLQSISIDSIRAEGIRTEAVLKFNRIAAKKDYATMWNKRMSVGDVALYGWDVNPWVWVIAFERIEKPW